MSKHGRAKQLHGPEPPPVHGNNTYNGRAHHHYQQQQQQQSQQFYGVQQSNVVGARPPSSAHHHHSLPRNAWSVDRHSPAAGGSSSNSSNERTYTASRRSRHHRVYNGSHRQSSRALHLKGGGGGGTTTDPDALSSVTTAGVKYGQQQLQLHHQSQHQLHHQQQLAASVAGTSDWPSEPSSVGPHQQHVLQAAAAQYRVPPQNSEPAVVVVRPPVTAAGLPTAASAGGLLLRHHQQPAALPLLFPPCDVAVDACGGHCPKFENICHYCLLVFYFVGITVSFLLIMAAVVSSRDPRFLYIGGLVLPVSLFLMVVQCRVRRDANRRKRHRQLNSRLHHRSNAGALMVMNSNGGTSQLNTVTTATETIPLQNITSGNNTLRRQFQGNIYQYVSERDEPNYNGHHYETASDLQQIEGVPWWRREDIRPYHGRTSHQ